MCTWPVVISVSTATRLRGSWASIASRIESLIWSAILSGWPSVTDSDVKRRRATPLSLGWVEVDGAPRFPAGYRRPLGGGSVSTAGRTQAGGDRAPDARGDGVLAAVGHLGRRHVGVQDDEG